MQVCVSVVGGAGGRRSVVERLNGWLTVEFCALWTILLLGNPLSPKPAAALDFYKDVKVGPNGTADCRKITFPVKFTAEVKTTPPISSVVFICSPAAKVSPADPTKEACSSELCLGTVPLKVGYGLHGDDTSISATGSPTSDEGIRWVFDLTKYVQWGEKDDDLVESDFYFKCEGNNPSDTVKSGFPCVLEIEVDIADNGGRTFARYSVTAVVLALMTVVATL